MTDCKKILIVEPWMCANGHPFQSCVYMLDALVNYKNVQFLCILNKNENFQKCVVSLKENQQRIAKYKVPWQNALSPANTVVAIFYALMSQAKKNKPSIFFFDGSFVVLIYIRFALFLFLIKSRFTILCMIPPEHWCSGLKKHILEFLLKKEAIRLLFRTEELCDDWGFHFNLYKSQMRLLPSLEVPNYVNLEDKLVHCENNEIHKFLIVGQLRPGKSIEKIINVFENNNILSQLKIVGSYVDYKYMAKCMKYQKLGVISNIYLDTAKIESLIFNASYIILLYGERWDLRMESGLLYLSTRLGTPVITYNKGWLGRMVSKYKCGIAIDNISSLSHLIKNIPSRKSIEYNKLVDGCVKFAKDHKNESKVELFLKIIMDA